ncbi:adenylate/guanylate cyclase domain-containing protein [Ruegeria sp. 2012CJ41-6]|uniref:Adenylate/guanylate cyclase domain-containing protein n=1 Tax=Ruegeria spongiae TaxID=2942209 RepID=A0ABT0Q2U1_9RHOB|nr:adenylate/guanylate cyclase domain-containing protein [Ruegeria spongiae]
MVGYARLVRAEEEATLAALRRLRKELIEPKIELHHGRIVKLMGDGILAEFSSVVSAVACSVEVQRLLAARDACEAQIVFRIGVNVDDVVIDGDDILGDGVNVAARLEALADPGGICISDVVYEQVRDRFDLIFRDIGKQKIKNINRPVQAWKWPAYIAVTDHEPDEIGNPQAPAGKPSFDTWNAATRTA